MCVFVCLSLVAELRRHNPDFLEVSGGVLVQQVIPDNPAHKYVHRYMKKKNQSTYTDKKWRRTEISPHQSSVRLNSSGFIKKFVICGLLGRFYNNLVFFYYYSSVFRGDWGGLKEGDLIVKLNEQPVQSSEDILEALQHDQLLLLEIRRGNDDLLFRIHPEVIAHWRTAKLIGPNVGQTLKFYWTTDNTLQVNRPCSWFVSGSWQNNMSFFDWCHWSHFGCVSLNRLCFINMDFYCNAQMEIP